MFRFLIVQDASDKLIDIDCFQLIQKTSVVLVVYISEPFKAIIVTGSMQQNVFEMVLERTFGNDDRFSSQT